MSIKQMTKVWEWSEAEGAALLVMLALADFCDDEGVCYPGISRIARKCRVSVRTTQRLIAELEASGELSRSIGTGIAVNGDRGPGHTNSYKLNVENRGCQNDRANGNGKGGDNQALKGVTNEAKGGARAVSPKPSGEPPEETSGFPLGPQGGGESSSIKSKMSLDEGFEDFWKAYPVKEKKAKALAAWKRHKCSAAREEVMLAVAMQKESPKWTKLDGRFIPYPTTWLNGHEWENESAESAQPQPSSRRGF